MGEGTPLEDPPRVIPPLLQGGLCEVPQIPEYNLQNLSFGPFEAFRRHTKQQRKLKKSSIDPILHKLIWKFYFGALDGSKDGNRQGGLEI